MKTSEEFINKFCTQHKQGTVKVIMVNQEAIWDNIPSQEFLTWLDTKVSRVELPVMQKIAGIRWEQRYSTTLEDDKMGRWMRIGRINGMTVAIILKAKERFIVKLPNNKGDESLENAIIAMSEQDAMLEAEKYIAKYVSNFSA